MVELMKTAYRELYAMLKVNVKNIAALGVLVGVVNWILIDIQCYCSNQGRSIAE